MSALLEATDRGRCKRLLCLMSSKMYWDVVISAGKWWKSFQQCLIPPDCEYHTVLYLHWCFCSNNHYRKGVIQNTSCCRWKLPTQAFRAFNSRRCRRVNLFAMQLHILLSEYGVQVSHVHLQYSSLLTWSNITMVRYNDNEIDLLIMTTLFSCCTEIFQMWSSPSDYRNWSAYVYRVLH